MYNLTNKHHTVVILTVKL